MNKYQIKVHKRTKESIEVFIGTAFEGDYRNVRKMLKIKVKELKKKGIDTIF